MKSTDKYFVTHLELPTELASDPSCGLGWRREKRSSADGIQRRTGSWVMGGGSLAQLKTEQYWTSTIELGVKRQFKSSSMQQQQHITYELVIFSYVPDTIESN